MRRDDHYPPPPPAYGPGRYDDRASRSYDQPPPPPHAPPPGVMYGHQGENRPPPPPPSSSRRESDRYVPEDRRADYPSRGPFSDLRRPPNGPYRDFRNDVRPPQGDFNFRMEAPPGLNTYRPGPQRDIARRESDSRNAEREGRSNRGRPRGRGGRDRGGRRHKPARPHERELLSMKHGGSELMLGDTTGRATYRDVDDLSDSDEAEMDISEDEDSGNAEPASKRARTTGPATGPDEAPKWSNPDPYTALPAPDDSTRKKKDMVHLIRKARVEANVPKPAASTEADDFIALADDDEEIGTNQGEGISNSASRLPPPTDPRVLNAPTGPRAASSTLPPKPPVANRRMHPPPAPPAYSRPVDLTPSTDLGNRKRTIDDEIKQPDAALKKATKMAANGAVIAPWQPVPEENPCPWATTDHSQTVNMGTRLHKEIIDFYEYVKPRPFEEKMRQELLDKLTGVVQLRWTDAQLLPFGSFKSGIYLPTADMDIAFCSKRFLQGGAPKYDKKSSLFGLKAHLLRHNVAFNNEIEVISQAKVPLVKFADEATSLKVDISFEKLDGQLAIDTFLAWKEQYPVMPIIASVIKHFLLMRGLNEPVNGGIGGFSVICMVVNLLNQMPQVQSRSMVPEHHTNEVLMEFLHFYGFCFEYERVAIRMNPPGYIPKKNAGSIVYKNFDRLSIIDPNNPENDIAGGSKNTGTILHHFKEAYTLLKRRMQTFAKEGTPIHGDTAAKTILGPLFAGKYSNFELQRNWLEKLAVQGLHDYGRQQEISPW
ncbi:hypothetical protein F4780DRAFT_747987 [Xylariomycetidae sp. FL0641]|nr:hypothetical protein F4780DRAFT_747987 [Xylariomycetidae sp. FL0641]